MGSSPTPTTTVSANLVLQAQAMPFALSECPGDTLARKEKAILGVLAGCVDLALDTPQTYKLDSDLFLAFFPTIQRPLLKQPTPKWVVSSNIKLSGATSPPRLSLHPNCTACVFLRPMRSLQSRASGTTCVRSGRSRRRTVKSSRSTWYVAFTIAMTRNYDNNDFFFRVVDLGEEAPKGEELRYLGALRFAFGDTQHVQGSP